MLESGLQVKLPSSKSSTATQGQGSKPTFVTVSKDGRISVNEKEAGEENLQQILKDTLAKATDRTVIIRGDESIFLGKAVKIMDAARGAGAEKIALATQPAAGTQKQ